MSDAMYDKVNLMLRLYDLRREARLRQARDWFGTNFNINSGEEMLQKYPPGSEENTYIRMVVSYWDMCAAIANRGLLDDDMFFENAGEAWFVWEKIKPVAPLWRTRMKNPHIFASLEELAKRIEAWREKRSPGTTEAMREMMKTMAQAALAAKK